MHKSKDDSGSTSQRHSPGFLNTPTLMILPVQAILFFLVILPTAISIWLSLTFWQPNLPTPIWEARFIYFDNFLNLFLNQAFIESVVRTVGYTAICITMEFLLGLFLASLFTADFFGKRVLFPALVIPLMIAPIVVGNNFWLLFAATGPVNQFISLITGTTFVESWFSHPTYAFIPIVLAEIWHWYPLMFLILLSGMMSLPVGELRAAEILRASDWQIFWRIKLPKLRNVILVGLVIRSMEALKVFDTVYLLTGGGPGTITETISWFVFKHGFLYSRVSYVSAGAWIILLICIFFFSFALKSLLMGRRST